MARTKGTTLAKVKDPTGELLLEARRTTHAVRALARFVLIFITYQTFAGVLIGLGLYAGLTTVFFVGIGALLVIIGMVHALVAAWDELGKSTRTEVRSGSEFRAALGQALSAPDNQYSHRLFDGECDCTAAEREESGTGFLGELEFCVGCSRALPKRKS